MQTKAKNVGCSVVRKTNMNAKKVKTKKPAQYVYRVGDKVIVTRQDGTRFATVLEWVNVHQTQDKNLRLATDEEIKTYFA